MPWISGNYYLNISQMQNNVDILYPFFSSAGWTDNAIAGMLGNMQTESTINPGIWESLEEYGGGYGIVQWTPYTNYSNWAGDNWQKNGQLEMERIIYELENNLQWINTSLYPMSFSEFVKSEETPAYLAQVWLYNYERPQVKPQPARSKHATYWYEYITGHEPPVPHGTIPVWLMFKFNERRH